MDKRILAGILAGCFIGPAWAAAEGPDANTSGDSSRPAKVVSDSPVTAEIKSRLAASHNQSLPDLKVDMDPEGTVWLSGRAYSEEAADQAEQIARSTQGVAQVKNNIVVAPETRQ